MEKKVRAGIYAGSFYPADKNKLSKMVNSFIKNTNSKNFDGKLCALIVPHAGYIYSGSTAGFAYKLLQDAKPNRIVLIGPSHQDYFKGAFGFEGTWETPLGKVKLEKPFLSILENDSEHSLEVQLPFLQTALKKFSFLPIIYGETNPNYLSNILSEADSSENVFIASSDLSHYFDYNKAKKLDEKTINAILNLDLTAFVKCGDACGKTGIGALIILAIQRGWKTKLLDYKNSGDTAGDKSRVVGYTAIAFFKA
ncbi:MAG: AmmeMemoRadiSam system protein B [archaeon]